MPANYNDRRLNEQPIPPVEFDPMDDNEFEMDEYDLMNAMQAEQNDDENESQAFIEENHEANNESEIKIEEFEVEPMAAEDLNAVDNIFAEVDEPLNDRLQEPPNNGVDEADTSDDSIECTFESLNDFRPMIIKDGYEIKSYEILSDNIPIKTNVRLESFLWLICNINYCDNISDNGGSFIQISGWTPIQTFCALSVDCKRVEEIECHVPR